MNIRLLVMKTVGWVWSDDMGFDKSCNLCNIVRVADVVGKVYCLSCGLYTMKSLGNGTAL